MSLETSRLRITGVNLVNGAYELQTERHVMIDNILFVPGLSRFPSLPLPFDSKLVGAGDSITAAWWGVSSGAFNLNQKGIHTWALAETGGAYDYEINSNQGVSGNKTAALLSRYGDTTAQKPKVVVLLIGTNDLLDVGSGAVTPAQAISGYQTLMSSMLAQNRSIGCRTVIIKILPRGLAASPMNANQITAWEGMNNWLETQAIPGEVAVVDAELAMGNGDAEHTVKAGFSTSGDGLHPNTRAAQAIGALLAPVLSSWIQSGNPYPIGNNDASNYIPNGHMEGGATIATGWAAVATTGGATVSYSKIARTDGVANSAWQQVDISGTYTGNNRSVGVFRSDINNVTDTLNVGDKLRLVTEFETDGPLVGISRIGAFINFHGGGQFFSVATDINGTPDTPCGGVFKTPPFEMTSNPGRLQANHVAYLTNTAGTDPCSGIIRFGRIHLEKIV
jgi:lysophospholipase L1-like esterase